MSLAIVVPGVVRNMANASSSWNFKGDYFLIADQYVYESQKPEVSGDVLSIINDEITKTKVKFEAVTICGYHKQYPNVNEIIATHSTINMAWKWKIAFHLLMPYHQIVNYDKVLILRPDMWVNTKTNRTIDDVTVELNTIYTLGDIGYDLILNDKMPMMADTFLMCDINTFHKLSLFYDFYLNHYEDILYKNYDVHRMLARYVIENNILIDSRLGDDFCFVVLRGEASNYMFENNILKPQYSHMSLANKNAEYIDDIRAKISCIKNE